MKTVKCAVIGAGWWGTTAHIPALKRHPLAELVAVHSPDAERARLVATDFCVPQACATMQEVLTLEGPMYPNGSLVFSPDGRWLATGGGGSPIGVNPGDLRLWDGGFAR